MISKNTYSDYGSLESESEASEYPAFVRSKSKNYLESDEVRLSSVAEQVKEGEVKWVGAGINRINNEQATTVFDVAAYIVNAIGPISIMKLQKLVYYAQAWSLVWDELPIFNDEIEAWANGPIVPGLFYFHRGQFSIASVPIGNPDLLNAIQKETVDSVLDYYGNKPAQWLIDLSHQERPWQEARKGLSIGMTSNRVIPLDLIAEYYSSLDNE